MEKETMTNNDPRRNLPSVSRLLEEPSVQALYKDFSRTMVMEAVHKTLDRLREEIKEEDIPLLYEKVIGAVKSSLHDLEFQRIRPVVNATGIILHTNLGRAVLPQKTVDALTGLNRCCNLQIDLETGQRGKRNFMTEYLLTRLTGAEAAMVVNNNAAATFLVLSALSKGKEVIISRGQLIEIGGSFRLPDCIYQSGAIMVEVGTTNKTHLKDYECALSMNTGMILRVNPSNYRIIGFSEEVSIEELVKLKKKQPVIVADDLGCGALVDLTMYGLPKEKTVQESIAAGADLVFFSGDKLIGGPQAGIIAGKKNLIEIIKKHPLTRMLRVGKMTDTALEQTLRLFLEPETLIVNHPTLRMMTASVETLRKKAKLLKKYLNSSVPELKIRVMDSDSETGGGSMPGVTIPSCALAISSTNLSADDISSLLRRNEPPVIGRIREGEVLLDMRTLLEGEERDVREALERLGKRIGGTGNVNRP
jgi:L-seryl-tRNA(Ser) seleniumtransferase